MALPIFFPSFVKKYIVQIRSKYGEWKEYDSYRSLEQAERAVQKLRCQNSEVEIRILHRFTGQVVKS